MPDDSRPRLLIPDGEVAGAVAVCAWFEAMSRWYGPPGLRGWMFRVCCRVAAKALGTELAKRRLNA